ncbi:DNA transformation protein [Azospirillum fermentarium]|uniref:TfoX/Sxy family protein n=1 Tax=Azospirillum fermentarium TaxID=1233114 RepID=UPI002226C74D|nr:TfoX/Sxy family protein [Azospirillum fermentarium]MCW2246156.1 DNA transformation protein [Azospirillum fermentarium]
MLDDLAAHICEMLAPMGEITVRRMFGGYCLYCDRVPFALISEGVFYVKADDQNRPAFLDAGLEPFRPFADKPTALSYYPVPESALDDRAELLSWTRPAFDAGLRAAAKKRARKKKAE